MARSFITAMVLALISCDRTPDPINQFSDPLLLKIADLQDRRAGDSLYPYLNHPKAVYRRHAVRAFGSLQQADKIDRIGKLLVMDTDPSVRQAAGFSLGQMDDPAAERLLLGALMKEKVPEVVAEMLSAYGKTTRRWQLDPSLFMGDSVKTAGLAWSLYRAGIRGRSGSEANRLALQLLEERHSEDTRLGAAHFFARGATDFQHLAGGLSAVVLNDTSPAVRMAAALALGKVRGDSSLNVLKEVIRTEEDTRVVVNAYRALRDFPFPLTKHYLYQGLVHKDINVGISASEVIIDSLTPDDWIEVSALTEQVENWRIKANLYEAALKAGGNKDLAEEIQARVKVATVPWQRAALLASLGHYPAAFGFVAAELRAARSPVLRSAAAQTLLRMNRSERFTTAMTPQFASLFRQLLLTKEDPAVIGSIAMALGDSTLDYRRHFRDASLLRNTLEKLALPRDNEAIQALAAAINYLANENVVPPVVNAFNHPVDWDLAKRIPHDQRAVIKTTRGNVIIRLYVNEAPGTVANFVRLALEDYFDNAAVHRVVPNFVVQDGCHRGDGWGSEDYSIRSEFSSRPYRTGSVGMASAGKDTEGTQWFITHSPTPHLEGRYTLFAEVVEGQAVVDFLQVGEKITDVELENFSGQ